MYDQTDHTIGCTIKSLQSHATEFFMLLGLNEDSNKIEITKKDNPVALYYSLKLYVDS
ncbi:hypothetical protein J6590_034578, partial [Homalodisca vitripennis]